MWSDELEMLTMDITLNPEGHLQPCYVSKRSADTDSLLSQKKKK